MGNDNFYALIARHSRPEEDAACLIDGDGGTLLTYAELGRRSARFAGLLRDLGLRRGDRLVAQVEKSPHAILLYLACLRSGIIFIPLNTAYTPREVEAFVADAGPGLLVCRPEAAGQLEPRAIVPVVTLGADGGGSFTDGVAGVTPATEVAPASNDDCAAILYTSGTTGRSKGAMLTHGNLASNAQALTGAWGWRKDDVLLHALPVYHAHGLFVGVHLALLNGSTIIFLPQFSAEGVIENLPRATVFMGVPTFYTRLLAHDKFDRDSCAKLRLCICGSAPLQEETFKEFDARTGLKILERYGMTEALMITSNPLDGERRAGTVGFPLPGVSVRVVDEGGIVIPAGQVGELQISGPNVFAGYWRQPERTAAEFTGDGFFRTGDLASIAEDGRITLVGRSKDLIISGGLNVYPKEVENAIDSHASVAESAVIGLNHPDFGEAVVAIIVPVDHAGFDEEVMKAWLRETLAGFKRPKLYIVVDELPRNPMGKVQKKMLRKRYANYFTA